jgi:hypothetical protein
MEVNNKGNKKLENQKLKHTLQTPKGLASLGYKGSMYVITQR